MARSFPDDIRLLYAGFVAGDLVLIAAKALIDYAPGAIPHFFKIQLDAGLEGVFATWYASLQLLLVGLLAICHVYVAGEGRAEERPRGAAGWIALAAIFIWLSMDETSQVHERIGDSLAERLGAGSSVAHLKDVFVWLLPFAPLALAAAVYLAVFCWRALRNLPAARAAALCGVGFFVTVYLAEYVEGRRFEASGEKVVRVARGLGAIIEEGSEMAGATCFLFALGESLRSRWPRPRP